MSKHRLNVEDYYCAQRDTKGNIRLCCGAGLLVANADDTIDDVQKWFDNANSPRFKEQYRSALKLMNDELADKLT